jgi:hypothetical protein
MGINAIAKHSYQDVDCGGDSCDLHHHLRRMLFLHHLHEKVKKDEIHRTVPDEFEVVRTSIASVHDKTGILWIFCTH